MNGNLKKRRAKKGMGERRKELLTQIEDTRSVILHYAILFSGMDPSTPLKSVYRNVPAFQNSTFNTVGELVQSERDKLDKLTQDLIDVTIPRKDNQKERAE